MNFRALFVFLASFAVAYAQCNPDYRVQVFTGTSRGPQGLTRIVNRYRTALGGVDNGNSMGPLPDGQRSINWDAPGNILPFDMPFDFFDRTVPRGFTFQAGGRRFAVSNPDPEPPMDDRFSSILPRSQSRRFRTFSAPRLFTPVNNNRVTIVFRIPATRRRANTVGLGAIFTDVDLPGETYMDFFDRSGCRIWRLVVPPSSRGLSFAGIIVRKRNMFRTKLPVIWRVVIRLGTVSVTRFRNTYRPGRPMGDVCVIDDIIMGEPQA